jgi:superfamily I DNA/RNA helicase
MSLGRYLGQIAPLGRDRAATESEGVRVMTMAGAKGLTVRATIIAALEEGLVPARAMTCMRSDGSSTWR